tara:strand:+ start:510 stop:719 length:210 start_codon:yes stop_codon:yes gene_type:complete
MRNKIKKKVCAIIKQCNHRGVPAKTARPKSEFVGFAVDKEMFTLIKAGAKIEGDKSKFLRAAVKKYFDK